MTSRTSWVAGNGQGLSWSARTILFGTADLTSLADSNAVLSSATAINNGSSLDQYCDVSVEIIVVSSTPRVGAYIGIWLAMLQQDGTTYGDGVLVAGTAAAYQPPWAPLCTIPLSNTAMTTMSGQTNGLILPPGQFKLIAYNFTNVTFSGILAANNVVSYRTYNQNLNA